MLPVRLVIQECKVHQEQLALVEVQVQQAFPVALESQARLEVQEQQVHLGL